MGDNGGSRPWWWRKGRKPDEEEGAEAGSRPRSLIDLVPEKYERLYTQLGDAFPEQLLRLQVLYSASQRAFEARTRRALRLTIGCVLRTVLRDPRLTG
jgi:hypothetical protein